MLTKINALDRLMPQQKITGDQDAIRRAKKRVKQAKRAAKARRKARGPVVPKVIADRMAPARKRPAPAVFTSTSAKDDVLRFENSRYWWAYARRSTY